MGKSRVHSNRWSEYDDDDIISESKRQKQRNQERRQNKRMKNALKQFNVHDMIEYFEDE